MLLFASKIILNLCVISFLPSIVSVKISPLIVNESMTHWDIQLFALEILQGYDDECEIHSRSTQLSSQLDAQLFLIVLYDNTFFDSRR